MHAALIDQRISPLADAPSKSRNSYAPKQKDAETNCRFPFPDATSLTSNKMHRAAVSDPNPITKTPTMEITKTLCSRNPVTDLPLAKVCFGREPQIRQNR